MMGNREQLLRDIGIADFMVTELVLEYFNHYNRIKNQMEKEFSQKYFPLNVGLTECSKEWSWGAAPLPWEGECG